MALFRTLACLLLLAALPWAAGAQPLPRLEKLEAALALTPGQKAQFEAAEAATRRVGVAVALAAMEAKERLRAELRKPRPDFGVLADAAEDIVSRTRDLRREAKAEWEKLYAMLDADQVATLKRYLGESLEGLDSLHDFLRGRPSGWV